MLVANQAELVLAKFILESRTKQVLEHACLALSKLAGFGNSFPSACPLASRLLGRAQVSRLIVDRRTFMCADSVRAYIIQSELVKKLISLLGYSDQSLVGPVTTTIGLVAVKGTVPTPVPLCWCVREALFC